MTKAKTSKAKKLTPEQATLEVYRLFCRGMNRDYILEYAKAQKWGLSPHVMTTVIDNATTRLIETAGVLNLDTEVGKALERLESLFQSAVAGVINCPTCSAPIEQPKDPKTALAVQKEINSLLRLGDRARRVPALTTQPATSSRLKIVA